MSLQKCKQGLEKRLKLRIIRAMLQVEHTPNQRLTRFRHEESQNHLARGVECLLLAEETGYQDRELLTEACDSFLEAIKFNRQQTDAYVGMAYLLWLLGDAPQALRYLEQGLRTNPAHPDVHALIQRISGRPSGGPRPQAEAPPDARVSALVQELIAEVMAENTAALVATVNPHALERLQEHLDHWEGRYDEVLTAIDGLSTFHERVLLACELGPVQDRILSYHAALKDSERLLALDERIHQSTLLARETADNLEAGDPGMYRATTEMLLDQCDIYADELDRLEQEGLQIRTVDSHYQQLVEHLDVLQQHLEDS